MACNKIARSCPFVFGGFRHLFLRFFSFCDSNDIPLKTDIGSTLATRRGLQSLIIDDDDLTTTIPRRHVPFFIPPKKENTCFYGLVIKSNDP